MAQRISEKSRELDLEVTPLRTMPTLYHRKDPVWAQGCSSGHAHLGPSPSIVPPGMRISALHPCWPWASKSFYQIPSHHLTESSFLRVCFPVWLSFELKPSNHPPDCQSLGRFQAPAVKEAEKAGWAWGRVTLMSTTPSSLREFAG